MVDQAGRLLPLLALAVEVESFSKDLEGEGEAPEHFGLILRVPLWVPRLHGFLRQLVAQAEAVEQESSSVGPKLEWRVWRVPLKSFEELVNYANF